MKQKAWSNLKPNDMALSVFGIVLWIGAIGIVDMALPSEDVFPQIGVAGVLMSLGPPLLGFGARISGFDNGLFYDLPRAARWGSRAALLCLLLISMSLIVNHLPGK